MAAGVVAGSAAQREAVALKYITSEAAFLLFLFALKWSSSATIGCMETLEFFVIAMAAAVTLFGFVAVFAALILPFAQTFFPMSEEKNASLIRAMLQDDEEDLADRQERAQAFADLLNRQR